MSESKKLDLEKRVLQHLNRIYSDVLDSNDIDQLSNSLLDHVVETQMICLCISLKMENHGRKTLLC